MNILRISAKLEAVFLNRTFQICKDSIKFWVVFWETLCWRVWTLSGETSGARDQADTTKTGSHTYMSLCGVSLWFLLC